MTDWKGMRILIIGAARQGLALARYLSRHGARVTLNDQRPAEKLRAAQESLQDLPITWATGSHPFELLDGQDLVCISGGVPLNLPIVVEAGRRGLPISNDSQIFMQVVPCPVIGITGSAGKTTTTTLVSRMAQAYLAGSGRTAWTGGNIGQPLIDFVDQMQPDDLAIVEISSFQLEQMTIAPHIAAILNITPNHLDRHGTLENYTAAKARLIDFQTSTDTAVLSRENAGAWNLRAQVKGSLISFGFDCPQPDQTGTYLAGGQLCLQSQPSGTTINLMSRDQIELRGDHNLLNVLAACAIAHAAGFSPAAMHAGVAGFHGVAHRLEFVRTFKGAAWYNDSIATAPERTSAAIHSFTEPLVLLLGGRDKNLPWQDLARLVHQRVDHLIVFGEAAPIILSAIAETQPGQRPFTLVRTAGLQEAVTAAAAVTEPGDVVLLSPGGTSFDEFIDFEKRGERYREWVNELR